jgi:hypothetical protein
MSTQELITKAAAEILICERPSRITSVAMLEMLKLQADKIAELEKERDEYHAMVVYMGAIMDESEGVAGYHLNGDIAKWDDLFTTSILEDAALIRDLEQQAKGRLDGVAYALNMYCTAMSPKEFPPIGAYYASQLQDKALKEGK